MVFRRLGVSKVRKILSILKSNLLAIILVLQPFMDILAYVQRDSAVSIAGYFRLGVTVLIPMYVVFFTKERKRFIAGMSVIVLFCVMHILNCFRVGYINVFIDVKYMLLVAHAIVLLFSFIFLYEKKEILRQTMAALKIMIAVVAVSYYLSYFLKSGIYTYIHSEIGWTGWNNTPSVFSVILSSLFPFAVYFCISTEKKWPVFLLLPISFMYVMNGTKAAYLTLIGTMLCCVIFIIVEYFIQRKEKFPIFICIALSVILVASIAYYNYSPRLDIDTLNNQNLEKTEENLTDKTFEEALDEKMIERFGLDRYLSAYKGENTAENLANNRLKKIIFGSLVWEETDTLTKFVGFEQTKMYLDGEVYDLESDPQAIFFYYGYIGAALYGLLLLYFLVRLMKQLITSFKQSFNLFNFVLFINYGLLMVSTVYTGHLLRRPNSAIYLTIVLLLIYCRTDSVFKRKIKQ